MNPNIETITSQCRANFNPNNIPAALKEFKGWLVWRAKEKAKPMPNKFDKVPFYPSGQKRNGTQGSDADKVRLGTFDEALTAFKENARYSGLGLAMLPDWGLVAFDGDGCLNAQDEIDADVDELTQGTYTEVSPSGRGIRAFFKGGYPTIRQDAREIYSTTQFVTVTGNSLDNTRTIRGVSEVQQSLQKMFPKPTQPLTAALTTYPTSAGESPLVADLKSALECLDPDTYGEWLPIGMALKTAPIAEQKKNDIWHWWSAKSDNTMRRNVRLSGRP